VLVESAELPRASFTVHTIYTELNESRWLTSCRHEIGYSPEDKQKESPKWVIKDDSVYKRADKGKIKIIETHPEAPTEDWYAILTLCHSTNGHVGRDKVFAYVQSITPSISKGFVGEYVKQCCNTGKASRRKQKNVRKASAGEEPVKTDGSSKGQKRAIEDVDDPASIPAAKMLKAHSAEPAMVNAGDEQVPSLRNYSGFNIMPMKLTHMGTKVSIHQAKTIWKTLTYCDTDPKCHGIL
jgi:hypothetical protein